MFIWITPSPLCTSTIWLCTGILSPPICDTVEACCLVVWPSSLMWCIASALFSSWSIICCTCSWWSWLKWLMSFMCIEFWASFWHFESFWSTAMSSLLTCRTICWPVEWRTSRNICWLLFGVWVGLLWMVIFCSCWLFWNDVPVEKRTVQWNVILIALFVGAAISLTYYGRWDRDLIGWHRNRLGLIQYELLVRRWCVLLGKIILQKENCSTCERLHHGYIFVVLLHCICRSSLLNCICRVNRTNWSAPSIFPTEMRF